MHLRPHSKWFRDVVVILCSYEVVAITTHRVPTLTHLHEKYKIIGPVILAGLAFHFYQEDLMNAYSGKRRALTGAGGL